MNVPGRIGTEEILNYSHKFYSKTDKKFVQSFVSIIPLRFSEYQKR